MIFILKHFKCHFSPFILLNYEFIKDTTALSAALHPAEARERRVTYKGDLQVNNTKQFLF